MSMMGLYPESVSSLTRLQVNDTIWQLLLQAADKPILSCNDYNPITIMIH